MLIKQEISGISKSVQPSSKSTATAATTNM
jgi:hypothetical protein